VILKSMSGVTGRATYTWSVHRWHLQTRWAYYHFVADSIYLSSVTAVHSEPRI